MLEAIADFWKPVKRLQAQMKLKTEELQVGSAIVFGFVPQPSLSGRRFVVTAINTYKFGADVLTSFVLSQEQDVGASMIIADTGGEQYIAVSRRIATGDRNKIFSPEDVDAVIHYAEAKNIHVREVLPEYKGWIAPHYKREIQGVKGQLYRGDHRAGLLTGQSSMDFSYTLMVSDNNEHALEIEEHDDGHVEIYATVYRRMSDVGEVSHPSDQKEVIRPDVKLASNGAALDFKASVKPEPRLEAAAEEMEDAAVSDVQEDVVTTPILLPEFLAEDVVKKEDAVVEMEEPSPVVSEKIPEILPEILKEPALPEALPADAQVSMIIQPNNTQPYVKQEIKAMNKESSNFINESIDCALHVANKIIDEAIRNEMRINDVVRRVIGLPVSQQESVQIPVTLTDQDYSLLAIRYGISSGDHEAIKKRIIEDLGDFSGANKMKQAA